MRTFINIKDQKVINILPLVIGKFRLVVEQFRQLILLMHRQKRELPQVLLLITDLAPQRDQVVPWPHGPAVPVYVHHHTDGHRVEGATPGS